MGEYIIQPGDTLSKIAKMTGTTVEQLQKLNGIKNANLIFAGKTIQIPDIDSKEAFNLKGLSVEREIPKGEIRTVYAYIPPEGGDNGDKSPDKGAPKDSTFPWYNPGGSKLVPLYGYICPGDDKNEEPPSAKFPPEEGEKPENPLDDIEIRTVYAYIPPKDKGGKDGEFEIPPYLKRPPEEGEKPENPLDDIEIRTVYAYIPPKDKGGEDDKFEIPPYLKRPEEPEISATAKDIELLERRGASKTSNDPNGKAQFVLGDEAGEVSVTGNKECPDSITIKDNTNGGYNQYTYRLITDKEIADGKTFDGIPLSKDQFKGANGPFYVLIKVEDHNGVDLKASHTEVYRLEYTERDDGSRSYDLVQDEGMDGSDRSSMDYRRR